MPRPPRSTPPTPSRTTQPVRRSGRGRSGRRERSGAAVPTGVEGVELLGMTGVPCSSEAEGLGRGQGRRGRGQGAGPCRWGVSGWAAWHRHPIRRSSAGTHELARLTGVLDRARSGTPRAVVLSGDAGVGKTRVLTEAAAHATRTGMTVLTGHGVDLGDVGLPYLPFTEILGVLGGDERFAAALAAHPAVERLLGSGSGTDTDTGSRLRLFEGVAGLLADAADITPLLLVLEDLHWADQSIQDPLRFLLSRGVLQNPTPGSPPTTSPRSASYRWTTCTAATPCAPCSPNWPGSPPWTGSNCAPWPMPKWPAWSAPCGPHALSDTTVRRIVDRAEGNAFYAEELLAALPGDLDPAAPARDAQWPRRPPPHPDRATLRHRPAGAAHGRGRRAARRARPAA